MTMPEYLVTFEAAILPFVAAIALVALHSDYDSLVGFAGAG
jgi:hypothetical protein